MEKSVAPHWCIMFLLGVDLRRDHRVTIEMSSEFKEQLRQTSHLFCMNTSEYIRMCLSEDFVNLHMHHYNHIWIVEGTDSYELRLNTPEYMRLRFYSDQDGKTMSEYVRKKLCGRGLNDDL